MGKPREASESLRTAIKLEPYLSGVRVELARILETLGNNEEEVESLRREEIALMERDAKLLPGNSTPLYQKGMLHILLKDEEGAREAFEAACRVEPNLYQNWTALALICERQQDWTRALEVLGEMYLRRPDDPAIRGILQRIQASGGITPEMLQEAAEEKQKQQTQGT